MTKQMGYDAAHSDPSLFLPQLTGSIVAGMAILFRVVGGSKDA